MSTKSKNLIHMNDLFRDSLFAIFHLTDKLVEHDADISLRGKTIVLFFPESSIRTRVTFEKVISHRNVDEAVVGKDIICTNSIPAKYKEDFQEYQITLQHMKKANAGAILNPRPPFYRGEEVAAEVIDSEYFVGYGFKRHLLEVQQAIVCYLLK